MLGIGHHDGFPHVLECYAGGEQSLGLPLALQDDPCEVAAGIQQPFVERARRSGLETGQGERTLNLIIRSLDRYGPAGAQIEAFGDIQEFVPAKVGQDVLNKDRFASVDRGAAGTRIGPWLQAVERLDPLCRDAGGGTDIEVAARVVEQHDRANRVGHHCLRQQAKLIENVFPEVRPIVIISRTSCCS